MKEKRFRRRTALAAAILGASLSLTGFSCVRPLPFNPSSEIPEDVYGPPVFENSFKPEEESPESVYGPPVFEESEEPEETYDPSEERPVMVYGPPDMMGYNRRG